MKRFRLVAMLAAVPLILAGCSGNDNVPDNSRAAGDSTGLDTSPENDASREPAQGGSVVVGQFREAVGLDPTVAQTGPAGGSEIADQVYGNLFWIDEEGNPEPSLAVSLENIDPITWQLSLREGVVFSDGEPFNADAVKYNFERHMDPEMNSQAVFEAGWIDSIEIVDDLTVQINLKEPHAGLPWVMTHGLGWIGSPTAMEEMGFEQFNATPVGAGPFTVRERIPDERTVLERNPNYWEEGLPYLDEVFYRPVPDAQARIASVRAGDIDLGFLFNQPTDVAAMENDDSVKAIANYSNGAAALLVRIDKNPALGDLRVRRALGLAIDTQTIDENILDGTMRPRDQYWADDSPWHVDGLPYPEYDPVEAADLVEEYESETGEQVSFSILDSATSAEPEVIDAVQQMYTEVGMDVTINRVDVNQWLGDAFAGNFDLAFWAEVHQEDPEMITNRKYQTGGQRNLMGYSNDEVDEMLAEAAGTTDYSERHDIYAEVERITTEQMLTVWLGAGHVGWLLQPDVQGVETTTGGWLNLKAAWIGG